MIDNDRAKRLEQAFLDGGWTPEKIDIFLGDHADVLEDLLRKMFPTPFIDLTIEEAVTEQALEEANPGHGMMHRSVRRKLAFAHVGTIRKLVTMTEQEVVRIFGSSKQNKAFRAMEALLVKNGVHFGMKLS